jgi:hypothetical protein
MLVIAFIILLLILLYYFNRNKNPNRNNYVTNARNDKILKVNDINNEIFAHARPINNVKSDTTQLKEYNRNIPYSSNIIRCVPRFGEWLIDWEDEREVADSLYLPYEPPIKKYYMPGEILPAIEKISRMSLEEKLLEEENILAVNEGLNYSDDLYYCDDEKEVMLVYSSSHILQISYESITATLQIEFNNGSAYEYYDFPQNEWYDFKGADSKGKYAHENIYRYYRQSRIK